MIYTGDMSTRSPVLVEDPARHQLPETLARRVDAVIAAERAQPPRVGRPKGLAHTLRARFPEELLADMWAKALSGVCPLLVPDARERLGYRVEAGSPLSTAEVQSWLKMFLDRGYGAPAQHVQVEAQVRSEVAMASAQVDPLLLAPDALSSAGVDPVALLAAIRSALAPRPSAPVIDVPAAVEPELEPED